LQNSTGLSLYPFEETTRLRVKHRVGTAYWVLWFVNCLASVSQPPRYNQGRFLNLAGHCVSIATSQSGERVKLPAPVVLTGFQVDVGRSIRGITPLPLF